MAAPAEFLLARPNPDIFRAIPRPIEITNESAVIEAARLALVFYGLLAHDQTLTPLPKDHEWRKHDGSSATYLVEQEIGPNVVYICILEAEGETTSHYHPRRKGKKPDVYENFVCPLGKVNVNFGGESRTLSEGDSMKLLPETRHKVKAVERSILAIVMENAASYPRNERHIK